MFYLVALLTSYIAFVLIAGILIPFGLSHAPIKRRRLVLGRVVALIMLTAGLGAAVISDYNALNAAKFLLLYIGSTAILLVPALHQYRTKVSLSHRFR